MYKILSIYLLLSLHLDADIGCASSFMESEEGCFEDNLLQSTSSALKNLEKGARESSSIGRVKITKNLESIKLFYQEKEFLIERIADIKRQNCPPYCIGAISIGAVKTVGELETLNFINSLQDKKDRIVVDVRSVGEYKKSTIPVAINIPSIMLDLKSRYRDDILELLGAKKMKKKWYFGNIQKLLIFDNGILDNQATKAIESLIDIGYPKNKILYYRGGFNSWKRLGLTTL